MSTVKDFRCTGCNASLQIPPNATRGSVKCEFCGVECLFESSSSSANAEIAAKNNISSGVPLKAEPLLLHNKLVDFLCQCHFLPTDIFEEAEVVREERYYVPAYCFYCNSMASFTYEVGVNRTETYTVGYGKNKQVMSRTVTDWNPNSGMASASPTVFASGNREKFNQVKDLYIDFDPKKLIDVEELGFPEGTQTLNYDYPEPASFNEKVVPYVNELLEKQARATVAKFNSRNLVLSGGNIQKESTRVLLGLYKVIFNYKQKEYGVWVTGDGANAYHEGIPQDLGRKEKLGNLEKEHSELSKKHSTATTLMIFLAVITCGITLIFMWGKHKERKEELRLSEQKINDFKSELPRLKEQFKSQNKRLKGIYENI